MASLFSLWQIKERIINQPWSIFSLPPISKDIIESNPGYSEGCLALYADAFSSPYFLCIFGIGLCLWYLLDILGCYIYIHCVPSTHKIKLQKEQFAGNFISIIHALMIAGTSTLVTTQYTPQQALNAPMNDIIIIMYKYAATWSAAYFLLDAYFISRYYNDKIDKKLAFVVHHFCSGICMCSVLLTHPIVTYISALNFLIEWSTVILNIRIFARIWSLKYVYFVSGLGVIFTYPLTRVVWNSYMILISFYSEYLTVYTCPQAPAVLGGAEIFVCLLSIYYFATFIMRNPSKMYILKTAN